MTFLVDILANIAAAAASAGSARTIWWTWDEPECPTEIL